MVQNIQPLWLVVAEPLWYASFPDVRITISMKHRYHVDLFTIENVTDYVRESLHKSKTCHSMGNCMQFGHFANAIENFLDTSKKLLSQPGALSVVPIDGVLQFKLSLGLD